MASFLDDQAENSRNAADNDQSLPENSAQALDQFVANLSQLLTGEDGARQPASDRSASFQVENQATVPQPSDRPSQSEDAAALEGLLGLLSPQSGSSSERSPSPSTFDETDDVGFAELVHLRRLNAKLNDKITRLEEQVYLSHQQVNTLMPAIADLLAKKSSEPEPPKPKKRRISLRVWGFSIVLIGLSLIPWGIYQYRRGIQDRIEADVTQALTTDPQLALYRLTPQFADGVLVLTGNLPNPELRDRAEQLTQMAVPGVEFSNQIVAVHIPPSQDQIATDVQQVAQAINHASGINISATVNAGHVTLSGSVIQAADVTTMTETFANIPGVEQVSNNIRVHPLPISTRIYFPANSATVLPIDLEGKLQAVQDFMQDHPDARLRVVGYLHPEELETDVFRNRSAVDESETEQRRNLALARAQAVQTLLEDQGIDRRRMEAIGYSGSPADVSDADPNWLSQTVLFEVIPPAPIEMEDIEIEVLETEERSQSLE